MIATFYKEKMKFSQEKIEEYNELISNLSSFHEQFTTFIGFRYAEGKKLGENYGGFDDDGAWGVFSISIVLARHFNAIKELLSKKYPVQATILMRAFIETWFYMIMFFKFPQKAGDYFRSTLNEKGRPKYRPYEVKNVTIDILKKSIIPISDQLIEYLEKSYRHACEMVHLSNDSMYASFGITVGEKNVQFGASTENDEYLSLVYEQLVHVSSTFWLIFLLEVMPEDDHEYSKRISTYAMDYLRIALKLVKGWEVPF